MSLKKIRTEFREKNAWPRKRMIYIQGLELTTKTMRKKTLPALKAKSTQK
jgi:hypothetical protein